MDILIFVEVVGVVEVADVGPELQGEEGKRGPVDLGPNILRGDPSRQKRGGRSQAFFNQNVSNLIIQLKFSQMHRSLLHLL